MMLSAQRLLEDYRASRRDPTDVVAQVRARIAADAAVAAWIALVDDETLDAAVAALASADRSMPLYGVPFAVKDNIDVAGMATTAGCPGYAPVAQRTAPAVQRLLDAGAILIGKTNMDQFATGLVGTRSPYGVLSSAFDSERISGGSSSGSALVVALGHVAFALGTDTAGSGRVPAGFNELVGLKPTRGMLSTTGVVPACASLDCVSIMTNDVADAALVLEVSAAHDPEDPYSRVAAAPTAPRIGTVAVPRPGQLTFEEPEAQAAWEAALGYAREHFDLVEVDVAPLLDAAPLLYDAWVAERAADLGAIVAGEPDGLNETVASIIEQGATTTGAAVFSAMHELARCIRDAHPVWAAADALLLPTTPGHPTLDQVAADPVGANAALGRFTNFVNLMDLSAIAIPAPRRTDGLPFGVTLLAPAFHDHRLLELAAQWRGESPVPGAPGTVRLAVVGAHLSGLPLNHQLTGRGARLVAITSTAPVYRLYALPGPGLARPGLVRVAEGGRAIEAEVWELSPAALGELMTEVPAPLGIGRAVLEDGSEVHGFICEGFAAQLDGARDVTALGGWRAHLAREASAAGALPA